MGNAWPKLLLVVALLGLYPVQTWCESEAEAIRIDQEFLYLSDGESMKRMALGYDALLADVYWIRAIQYFGDKVLSDQSALAERSDKLKLLYPLADVATTLDPNYIAVYRFAGFFVHDYVDPALGVELLEKGVAHNPDNLPILQTLAFVYWSDGRCSDAARIYKQGAQIPNAPDYFRAMAATIHAECGDTYTTYRLLQVELANTEDPRVRETFEKRLLGVQGVIETNLLNAAVAFFLKQRGRNPESLPELMRTVTMPTTPGIPPLRVTRSGEPVDPSGVPYLYSQETGQVTIDPQSTVRLPRTVLPGPSRPN